jgi:hypothetical protein
MVIPPSLSNEVVKTVRTGVSSSVVPALVYAEDGSASRLCFLGHIVLIHLMSALVRRLHCGVLMIHYMDMVM